ncbi:CHAT domain-containing protein [Aureispira anguillae]|uniref:CHAT domain-containing protein n=1 Tax=Aureispira anguillae TaxID=2864201 RepID=A0A915YJF6_9BACT|nr:CHAT domain-containing protein [Aureispira anguillae]BDS14330.1 CHAT domain-containing protein [Aureispira anguillae]
MSRPIYINFLILLLLNSCLSNCYAQTNLEKTLARANKHIQDAERYYAEMKFVQAKESYQFAARLYRNNNLPAYYAICYNGIGNTYIDLTLYEEAKSKGFEKALQQLAEIKSIEPNFDIDSSLVADAYEGLGRYYSSISTTLQTQQGLETKIHYTKALEYHQNALRIRKNFYGDLHQKIALSYYFIGRCYRGFSANSYNDNLDDNPIQKELDFLKKALDIQLKTVGELHYQTANTYQALGNYYYETQKDYHKGVEYHKKAFKIRQEIFKMDHLQIASSYIDMSIYYRVMNIYDKELSYLEKALKIQLSILGTDHAEIAKSYYLLAHRYRSNGSIQKAISYYEYALAIFIKLKNKQSLEVAEVRLGLALCYRMDHERKKELQQLQQSLSTYEKILGKKHFKIGLILLEKGNYYLQTKQYDSTLFFYQKALLINQQQLGSAHYSVTDLYDKMARVYRLKGLPEKEFEYLTKSLTIKKGEDSLSVHNNKRPQQTGFYSLDFPLDKEFRNKTLEQQLYNSYMSLAAYYERAHNIPEALHYIQQALAAVCPSLNNSTINIYENPSTKDLSHNIQWLYALGKKAAFLQTLYDHQQEEKNLSTAIQTYTQGIDVINSLRTNFNSKKAHQELKKYSIPIYEGAITSLFVKYTKTSNPQYLNQAFEIAEYSKSFALIQGLQNTLARGRGNIPNQLLELERELRHQLAYYSNYQNKGAKNNQKFDKAYFSAKQSYDSLIYQLEKDYPTYYNLKYQTKVTSVNEVCSKLLHDNHILLEYFIGDQYLYVFRLSKHQKDFFQVIIPDNYEQLVYNLRSALTNYDMIEEHPQWAYQTFVATSYKFYIQFLAPFLPEIFIEDQELTIIPDGMLNYIPFEVLLSELPSQELVAKRDYKKLSFILKQHPISYNYSATIWANNSQNRPSPNNGQCLGFAPSIQFSSSHDSLPWTQKELEAIQRIFAGKYYYGKEANKALFKEIAGDFSIIHLATHGIVDMDNPMRSLLSFASDSSDWEHVALYAYEIHNLSLKADLVVLSACETGFGKAVRGEGVLSLARAFLYAGAPSVVTTLWEVNDFTSAALIETFYANLATGMPKSLALREAKLTFLSKTDEISGHPTYWASFVVIGNSSPIQSKWYWWLLRGVILLILLTTIGYSFHKKKSP